MIINHRALTKLEFQNGNGSVYYDKQTHCICLTLKGYGEGMPYRMLLDQAIEALKKYRTSKLLGDTTQSEVIALEDQEWTHTDWAERAIKAGLRYNAIILSTDLFGRLSIESIVDDAKVVKVRYFDNVQDALQWLKILPS